jgi:PAS domain S-box-containing protein
MPSFVPPSSDSRSAYYESATRLLRWASIALVLATASYSGLQAVTVYSTIAAAVIYNSLRYSTTLLENRVFASSAFSLTVDHLVAFVLILATGGLASPYVPFLYLLMIAAAYDLGGTGLLVIGTVQWAIAFVAWVFVGPMSVRQLLVTWAFSIFSGLLTWFWIRSELDQHSELMSAEVTAEAERQRLLTLINSLASAVLEIDAQGRVHLYNGAALELLNTNRDINGQPLAELLKLRDEHHEAVDIMDLLHSLKQPLSRRDLSVEAGDGTLLALDISFSPILVSSVSSGQGWIMVMSDITKQKTIEEERDEFISVVSHELRTPVAIAEANLSTALLPGFAKIESKASQLIEQAHQNMVFLGLLIKDLSTLAKAERRDQKVEFEAVSIPGLLDEVNTNFRAQAEGKGLHWSVEVDEGLEETLSSHYVLTEILQNFVSNAIKYTQKGAIVVSAKKTEGGIRLAVSDTGIGIAVGDKKHMFEKFYRAEDYRTRQTAGTGLGLYITRKLAARIGSKIDFESRVNSGSTFWVDVPQVSAKTPQTA